MGRLEKACACRSIAYTQATGFDTVSLSVTAISRERNSSVALVDLGAATRTKRQYRKNLGRVGLVQLRQVVLEVPNELGGPGRILLLDPQTLAVLDRRVDHTAGKQH